MVFIGMPSPEPSHLGQGLLIHGHPPFGSLLAVDPSLTSLSHASVRGLVLRGARLAQNPPAGCSYRSGHRFLATGRGPCRSVASSQFPACSEGFSPGACHPGAWGASAALPALPKVGSGLGPDLVFRLSSSFSKLTLASFPLAARPFDLRQIAIPNLLGPLTSLFLILRLLSEPGRLSWRVSRRTAWFLD